jgi:hypothetical protein
MAKSGLKSLKQLTSQVQRPVKKIWHRMTSPPMVSVQSLSDRDFLTLFNLAEVSRLLGQGDVSRAKAALLAYYGRRLRDGWLGVSVRLEEVRDFLVEGDGPREKMPLSAHLGHQVEDSWPEFSRRHKTSWKKLITWADLVLENRFVLGGMPEVSMEEGIDWHCKPTSDPEWTWTLNRHDWLPLLARVYAKTGDERYVIKLINLIVDWIDKNPPLPRKDESSPTWRLMEAGMRMYLSWVPLFGFLYHMPAFSDEAKLRMLRAIYDHGRFLSRFKTSHNHLLRESIGLAHVGIYFPEFKEADQWRRIALTRLDQELGKQVNRDGSHIEMATAYQWLVVDEYQHAYNLLQATNHALLQEDLGLWLENMYRFLVYLICPDYTLPQLNDGFTGPNYLLLDKLTKAGETFKRDDFVYAGTEGRHGACPVETSVAFENAGLYVMRTDWTRDARYLLFNAGPYGGPHGHEDKLSIELHAFGQPFIVDPGTYTYDQADPFRAYFVSSASHNLVMVDGKSQIRRWRKENLHPQPAAGNCATWISQADFDYVAATYNEGYSRFGFRPFESTVIEDVIHTRRILFVKPGYWVMVDELQATSSHDYQLLFHTPPEIRAAAGSENRIVLSSSPDGPSLYLIPAEPKNIKVRWVIGSEGPIQGWYAAPSYHIKSPATTVIYERENSSSTVITTLLYPCPAGETAESVTIEPLTVSGGQGLAFVVTTGQGKDCLMLSQNDTLKQFGPYQSRGIVAGIRIGSGGGVLSQFGSESESLGRRDRN